MDMLLIIAKKHGFYHNNVLISCKWMNVEKNVQKNVVVFGTQFRQFIFSYVFYLFCYTNHRGTLKSQMPLGPPKFLSVTFRQNIQIVSSICDRI